MSPELALAMVLVAALTAYVLFGGADFGAGVWDLFARGPRKDAQRAFIEKAIGPIWEANHVWLIFAAVLLFSAFPRAFAAISTALHVPLTLFLIGVVFRGSAFVFRSYDPVRGRRWGAVFSVASVASPVLLGVCVGALSSGRIRMEGVAVVSGFYDSWLSAFPFAVGVLTLAVCAFLAAVYLAREAPDGPLREDFRKAGLHASSAVAVAAGIALALSPTGAPRLFEGLMMRAPALVGAGALTALAATAALWTRRYGLARILAGAEVVILIAGWGAAQYPFLLVPDLTIAGAASNPATLRVLLWAVIAGVPILGPSLYVLFGVFKSPKQMPPPSGRIAPDQGVPPSMGTGRTSSR